MVADPNPTEALPEPDAKFESDSQVDPYLEEKPVTPLRVAVFSVAGAFILALVLWGLNAPPREETAAAKTPAPASASAGSDATSGATASNEKAPSAGSPSTGRADSSGTGLAGGSPNASMETTGQGGDNPSNQTAPPAGQGGERSSTQNAGAPAK